MSYCANCGKARTVDATFCDSCGTRHPRSGASRVTAEATSTEPSDLHVTAIRVVIALAVVGLGVGLFLGFRPFKVPDYSTQLGASHYACDGVFREFRNSPDAPGRLDVPSVPIEDLSLEEMGRLLNWTADARTYVCGEEARERALLPVVVSAVSVIVFLGAVSHDLRRRNSDERGDRHRSEPDPALV